MQKKNNNNTKLNLNFISKFFIYSECVFGVYRISVLNVAINNRNIFFMRCHYIFVNIFFMTLLLYIINDFLQIVDFVYFSTCAFLGNILHRRLYTFYDELNTFDIQFKYEAPTKNRYFLIYQFILFLLIGFIFITKYYVFKNHYTNDLYILAVVIFYILELQYHGHMFSLVTSRLKLITQYIQLLTPRSQSYGFGDTSFSQNHVPRNKTNLNTIITIQNINNMYNKIIYIHDCINSAIKWQVRITVFIIFEMYSYKPLNY